MITVDRNTIIQVLGGLMSKPETFSNIDKYKLGVKDFSKTLDRYIFSAIYNLYLNEAKEIHAIDVDNYLQSNPAAAVLFK